MTSPGVAGASTRDALADQILAAEAVLAELRARARALDGSSEADDLPPLHAWQREALAAWEAAGNRGVVEAVTGTGKTRVGVAAILRAHRRGRRSVILVPSKVLREQWRATLEELAPQLGVITGLSRSREAWDVAVLTPLPAGRHEFIEPGEQLLLVADEVHRYGSPKYQEALRTSDYPERLGLTATRDRGDTGDAVLADFFGPTCFHLGYDRAVADELIAPFRIAFANVPFTADERESYDALTETMRELRLKLGASVPLEPIGEFLAGVQRVAGDSTHRAAGIARWYLKLFNQRRELFAGSAQKRRALKALLPVIRDSVGTLVFTQTRDAAGSVARMLLDGGVTAAAVDGATADDDRSELIDLFERGEMKTLAAPVVFDEGLDLPRADLGVVIAATHRRRQMIQRFGRVLRKKPDGASARFVIFALSGSTEDPTAHDHEPSFADELAPFAERSLVVDLAEKDGLATLVGFLAPDLEAAVEPFAVEPPDAARNPVTATDATTTAVEATAADGDADEAEDATAILQVERVRLIPARETGVDEDEHVPAERVAARVTEDAVADYYRLIGMHPLLSAEEEVELARAIEVGLFAKERLDARRYESRLERRCLAQLVSEGRLAHRRFVLSNLRLVVSIAKRYHRDRQSLALLDLIQHGNEGLERAIRGFDFRRGCKFSTYATSSIQQAITRAVAKEDLLIRVPVHAVEGYRRWVRDEQAEPIDPHSILGAAHRAHQPIVSAEDLAEHESHAAHDAVHTGMDLVGERLDRELLARTIDEVLCEEFDARDRTILRMRYGLDGGQALTLDEVGGLLGITRERVRQLQKAAMTKLAESSKLRRLAEADGLRVGGREATTRRIASSRSVSRVPDTIASPARRLQSELPPPRPVTSSWTAPSTRIPVPVTLPVPHTDASTTRVPSTALEPSPAPSRGSDGPATGATTGATSGTTSGATSGQTPGSATIPASAVERVGVGAAAISHVLADAAMRLAPMSVTSPEREPVADTASEPARASTSKRPSANRLRAALAAASAQLR